MLTKNVFKNLAVFMLGFGAMIGIVFPFFVLLFINVDKNIVLTPLFFSMCIAAGLLVGLFNIFLAKKIVGKKLKQLHTHMGYIEKRINDKAACPLKEGFEDDKCFIKLDSDDVIGDCAEAFNSLVRSLAKAFRSEAAVRNFTEMLSSKLDLDELGAEALDKLIENMNAAGGAIIVDKEGELSVLSSFGINMPEKMIENNIVWSVIKNRKRLVIHLPEDISLSSAIVSYRPKTVLIEPILYKEIVLGVVVLATVVEFSEEMQKNIQLFGQGLALAFKNAITHDQLQRLAANDPLTGIYNRRFGLSRLKEEFARAVKTDMPLGIIMFDIDHFKNVNDTYGHLVGDRVLISLTRAAKSTLREGDVFLRYGGEEFLVVLPGASMADVKQLSERLRRIVEDTEIQNQQQTLRITVSVGGTSYPERNVEDHLALINIADKQLFEAKESGRNYCVIR
jgi:diguanylate cyclase (GGDEF)-like protein